jgi:hypothetical protein
MQKLDIAFAIHKFASQTPNDALPTRKKIEAKIENNNPLPLPITINC